MLNQFSYRKISGQHSEWKRHRWMKIKTKILKQGLNSQLNVVKRLPEKVQGWDITCFIVENINEIMV